MTDAEWALIEPLLLPAASTTSRGRYPEKWPRRDIVNGIRYLVGNGQCRCLRCASSSCPRCGVRQSAGSLTGHASMD
ncbi:transposase, partial [Streptomyces sp. NPDC000405]|uniref:transposase n=1 Tax=Streptomyces sp. NPDC000405 TaxID=3161033 RepID=UPI00398D4291